MLTYVHIYIGMDILNTEKKKSLSNEHSVHSEQNEKKCETLCTIIRLKHVKICCAEF